jgi:A/G-specific adenine glycosylase
LSDNIHFFVSKISKWGKNNRREFLWREDITPFKILIAEILLQRTRASQVEPVFKDFISEYPDFTAINAADVEDIRETIISLGLKKKAEGLKLLSNQVITEHDSIVPSDEKKLMSLHLVGRYTTNAVLSHAFDISKPTYDNNFGRVIERFFGLAMRKPLQKDKKGYNFSLKIMELVGDNHSEFNLYILDFVDNMCKVRTPNCVACPLTKK